MFFGTTTLATDVECFPFPRSRLEEIPLDLRTLRFVLPFAAPYWKRYLLGIALVPLSIAALLLIPWLTGESVERLRTPPMEGSGAGVDVLDVIGILLLGILGLAVVRGATLLLIRWLIISASRLVVFVL